ncbi:ATP-binding protein [Arthrobacter koreensis]|uniref:ATP-binding protein n=1 Tax=Arthrobacter koreensis TaxID=199136 RepID=A0ABY6FTC0_9MICC|nr:ATP-binding protein [Arthrobacter koreensis]UYB36360.1 ATP-binding protein [Arthrobacter koreensis]
MADNDRAITKIEAQGVLGEFSYVVEYPTTSGPDRMRLIYAPNGRGKTNFLRAVSAALTPTPESLASLVEIPFASLRLDFANGGRIVINRDSNTVGPFTASASAGINGEEFSVTVDPAELGGRMYRRVWENRADFYNYSQAVGELSPGAIFIGDDRLVPVLSDENVDGVRNEGNPYTTSRRRRGSVSTLLEAVERMLTQEALAALSNESEQTGIYAQITRTTLEGSDAILASEARAALEEQIGALLDLGKPLERYGLLSMRQVRVISDQISVARANARNLPAVHTILRPYLDSLHDQITALSPAQELIDTFVTSVNHFLDRKELQFTASRGIRLVGRDGNNLHPESLSSGERHLLLLLSQAVLATGERRLVIVDEPELSLGIEWQRDLLPEMLQCSAPGNVQFLVASHSLQVMNAIELDSIVRPGEPK